MRRRRRPARTRRSPARVMRRPCCRSTWRYLPGGSGRIPGRHGRRIGERDRDDRRGRRHHAVRPCIRYIQGLHQLGAESINPDIKRRHGVCHRERLHQGVQRPGDWHRASVGSSSSRTRMSTSSSRSPARRATASSTQRAKRGSGHRRRRRPGPVTTRTRRRASSRARRRACHWRSDETSSAIADGIGAGRR